MEPRRSKHFLAHIPTIALLVVFAMSAPLGVLFFILRAIDRDAEKKEQENAEYSSDFRPQDTGAGQPARDTEPVYGHDVPTAEQQNAKKWHKTLTSLCTMFGGIFLVVGLAGLADIIDLWGYWFDWGEFLTALAQTIGGGAALAMGLPDEAGPQAGAPAGQGSLGPGIISRWTNFLQPRALMPTGAAPPWSAPSTTAISGPMPISTTAPARWWCGRCAPAAQTRRARTRTGSRGSVCRPAAPASAGPTMPSPTR